ncbi:MAG: glycosyltransferase [Ardenticatenaceae bacterium]|nr:glycosyltransferase [Ardenticatenaceae bacterium]
MATLFPDLFTRRSTNAPGREKPVSEYVVAIVSDAIPERNGVGTYYLDLSQHLSQHVALLETISPHVQDGHWESGFSLPLPSDSTQRVFVPHFPRLKSRLDELQPDVVIVPTPGLFGLFGAYYGKARGARVLVGFHTWFEKLAELYWSRWQGGAAKGVLTLTNRLLFNYADCVLTTADFMIETAYDLGAKEARVIGTPLAYKFMHTPVTMPADNVKKVLFAGRLSAEKNIDAVIQAAHDLPSIHFSVAGDGAAKAEVEAVARKLPNFSYLGWLNRMDLLRQMDLHDMLVLPSHVESFGTVALESMARQRYTLVSTECGIIHWPELVQGLFIMGKGETLTQTLRRIDTMTAEERLKVAKAGREAAVAINNWNSQHWLDVLRAS